ncbi:MAG: sulfatase [Lewinella sp.]|nr:sulfatase [Lewinella sp.]
MRIKANYIFVGRGCLMAKNKTNVPCCPTIYCLLRPRLLLLPFLLLLVMYGCGPSGTAPEKTPAKNVLVIMVDDLNDNIGLFGGHPQAYSPSMDRFAQTATTFARAYTAAPMCGPSRASLFSGVYPHHSRDFFQAPWYDFPVLANTRTMMEQFKDAGYNVLGSGKIMHHNQADLWSHFENSADYTPTPFDGEKQLPHPDVPVPFSDIGWVDGSLGPFIDLSDRKSAEGKPLHWTTGNSRTGFKPMRYVNDDDRDPTPDEVNAEWAATQIKALENATTDQPFFMAVGFLRPHTPLVAPQKYFDRFPLDELELVDIREGDGDDTFLSVSYRGEVFTLQRGHKMFAAISEAYGDTELGLKKWTQAYLACVAAVDDNIGQVLEALDNSSLRNNTIVVLASDHGFHMGEKDYLYKNSLWEESTRVPLMIRVPGMGEAGQEVDHPVSLIDIYPTLVDLCGLPTTTAKNEVGHNLDGHSLQPFIQQPKTNKWPGPAGVLSVVYAGKATDNDPARQHYALRTEHFRYIRYNTGKEELYDHQNDPNEWFNLAGSSPENLKRQQELGATLDEMLARP